MVTVGVRTFDFRGCDATIGDVFGKGDMTFGKMQKQLWEFLRSRKLESVRLQRFENSPVFKELVASWEHTFSLSHKDSRIVLKGVILGTCLMMMREKRNDFLLPLDTQHDCQIVRLCDGSFGMEKVPKKR